MPADHSKLTPYDQKLIDNKRPLHTVAIKLAGGAEQIVEIHDTNSLFGHITAGVYAEKITGDDSISQANREAYGEYARAGRLPDFLKHLKGVDPALYARVMHFATMAANAAAGTADTAETRNVAGMPETTVCMSQLYEALVDLAPRVAAEHGEDPGLLLEKIL